MNKKNLILTLTCSLLAGSLMVQCDRTKETIESKESIESKEGCSSHRLKPRRCVYKGIFIAEGQTKPVAPCRYGTCKNGKVTIAIRDCARPPPNCRYESTLEQCCKLICNGCNYNGIFIAEGQTKPVAPCQHGSCNGGKVTIAIQDCARPPLNCRYESTLEQCCNMICEGCEYEGIFIAEGESETIMPCHYAICRNGTVTIAVQDCTPPPPGCRYESTLEQCCKKICDGPPIEFELAKV